MTNLHGNTNAQTWAREFMKVIKDKPELIDEGFMIGWFANAIESGRTVGYQDTSAYLGALIRG